ncbi:MAG: glycosyltransferase [Cyanobacteria bacterium J06606_4]
MRIAVVGLLHHPIAEPFAGGMESHTWWLTKKLTERGHQVTLFASGDSDPSLRLAPCIDRAFATNPRAQTVDGRQACNMVAYAKVVQTICQGSFDVIHNNALHPFLLLNAADMPTPMLTVLHTPVYPELAVAVRYAAARNTSGKLSVVAVSKSLSLAWTSLIDSQVVYNGIDVDSWPVVDDRPKRSAFWYGRFVPEKAPHLAIQAALMAGYHIRVAGPISDQAYFDQQILPLLKDSRVEYLGHLSQAAIKRALSQASVFVNTPLWEEPYGFVYAEALASGTPVATFSSGAAAEILTASCGVLAEERTVPALAKAVVEAAELSHENCRERARAFCDIESMVDGYERLYRDLVRNQQGQRKPKKREGFTLANAMIGITG